VEFGTRVGCLARQQAKNICAKLLSSHSFQRLLLGLGPVASASNTITG
jgi:hypothetical protein